MNSVGPTIQCLPSFQLIYFPWSLLSCVHGDQSRLLLDAVHASFPPVQLWKPAGCSRCCVTRSEVSERRPPPCRQSQSRCKGMKLGSRFCTWVGSMGVGPNLILFKWLWWVCESLTTWGSSFWFICNMFRALFFAVRAINHSVKINTHLRF